MTENRNNIHFTTVAIRRTRNRAHCWDSNAMRWMRTYRF